MGFTNAGLGVGGGSGNASVGGLLRQDGSDDHGIHISHDKGDLSWHMQVESRSASEDEVRASIRIAAINPANYITWTFPGSDRWVYPPETVNRIDVHERIGDGRATASLLLAREGSPNHNGRLLVKYPIATNDDVGRVVAIKRPAQDNGTNSYVDVLAPDGRRLFRLASNLNLQGNRYWLRFRAVGTTNRLSFARQNSGNQPGFRISYSTDGTAGSRTVQSIVDSFGSLISPTGVTLSASVLDGNGDYVVDFDDLAGTVATSPEGGYNFRLKHGRTGIGHPRHNVDIGGVKLIVARSIATTTEPTFVFEHASARPPPAPWRPRPTRTPSWRPPTAPSGPTRSATRSTP